MRRWLAVLTMLGAVGGGVVYADEAAAPAAAPEAADASAFAGRSPADVVANAPKGSLHNPFSRTDAEATGEGHKKLLSYGCSGCHGGNGGGGMCPPLTNGVWIYGGDDDTLYRLVTLGSADLQKQGYTVKAMVKVVGPMPSFAPIIKDANDVWKILAFVRSVYHGPEGHLDR